MYARFYSDIALVTFEVKAMTFKFKFVFGCDAISQYFDLLQKK